MIKDVEGSNMRKKILVFIIILSFISGCTGCRFNIGGDNSANSQNSVEIDTLNIAYQYGLAYAPLIICQKNSLIEKAYKEATGKQVEVIWTQMSSGADINTGIASENINVGFMGIAPAITGISKDVGYKIFTNLSGQAHGMITNDDNIDSLKDLIGSDNQIALVNIGSIQHIILAKALVDNGYNAHALDSNIIAMKHPDGMSSLETGSIACHLTTNPYIEKERNNKSLWEIPEVANAWSLDNSFIVGVAAETLYSGNIDLYDALCIAIADSVAYINNDAEAAAALTCEYNGNTLEEETRYIKAGVYSVETKGIFELAKFMHENDFIDNRFETYSDLVYANVAGN